LFYQTSPKGILEEFSARLKQILWIFFVASLNQFLPDWGFFWLAVFGTD
jgi:hypothetical protein